MEQDPHRIRERLADIQHQVWTSWMEHLFSVSTQNPDGSYSIAAEHVARWQRQMATPYSDLSDDEQESDRQQADKVLAIILNVVAHTAPPAARDAEEL